ncbi:ABC transporter related protein [Ferroglobus placidus DSM 10642]|uniref:ABC transporter related protein n=1 Tax=Ferroglobus placidus (strain DSM 10642 / AEDII12DO) TaxID=589924 RepID=D3RZ70_FERPA|nr:ATP-binding cassette domain-containing protein [Ferroglobus placidus]ADC65783.1 ABC transporter related protein [Ferroglobus placidus DSM 10642]
MIELSVEKYVYPNGEVGLENLKLELYGNEIIIGSTGSGKSTLLKLLNGLIPNFYGGELRGSVKIFGGKPNPKDVAYVKQIPEESITCSRVKEELIFPLIQRGWKKSEALKEAEELAEELRISHLLERYTFELSTGELQLVEIASAILSSSKLIALDEPFAHLSERSAKRVIEILKDEKVVVAEHRIEFSDCFERIVNFGIEEKSYPELKSEIGEVIHDGALRIRKGEIVAVIGENGAGKTMLLKKLAKEMRRLDVGIVLQNPAYHLTEKRVKDEAGNFLSEFELEKVANRHPQSLSVGQMRKVAIAKAFKHEVLLLDEPTAGLDVNFREKLLYLLRKYRKTAVIATHDLKLASSCDRVVEV